MLYDIMIAFNKAMSYTRSSINHYIGTVTCSISSTELSSIRYNELLTTHRYELQAIVFLRDRNIIIAIKVKDEVLT